MNWFADLRPNLLQVLMHEPSGPADLVIDLVFDARDGQRPLEVALICDPEPVRATIAERGSNEASVAVALDDVTSPGRSVRVGAREVHLQYVRARNDLCRGPLVVFEGGAPLPCWLPRRGFRRLLPRGNTTTLAVFVVGEAHGDSFAREVRSGLELCEALMKGLVSPGFEESAYFTPPPPSPTPDPVLRASDLNAESALVIDAARESATYKDYDDGGALIAYQYRHDAADGVMVNSQAVLHAGEAEARSHYEEVVGGAVREARPAGQRVVRASGVAGAGGHPPCVPDGFAAHGRVARTAVGAAGSAGASRAGRHGFGGACDRGLSARRGGRAREPVNRRGGVV